MRVSSGLLGRVGRGEEGGVLDLAVVVHVDSLEEPPHLHLRNFGVALHRGLELVVRDRARVVRVDGLG